MIDLVPDLKYCVTRQGPVPRGLVEAIDAFFDVRRKARYVRESLIPDSSIIICV